ncbi:AAA family ATPase [Flindersiella endophytica]
MRGAGTPGDVHRRAVLAAVDAVLARVDAHAADAPKPVAVSVADEFAGSALGTLCACFGLTEFETDVLVLAAAMELDPTAAGRCASAGGERPYPTFSLALAALTDPHWSALTRAAPLRRYRLLELDDSGVLTTSRLRIDERVLHFLLGVSQPDVRLEGIAEPVGPLAADGGALPASHQRVAGLLAEAWDRDLVGADPQTRREIAAAAASECGLALYVCAAAHLPADPGERAALARIWEREAVMLPAALLVEVADATQAAPADAFAAGLNVPVVLSSTDLLPASTRIRERVMVPGLEPAEQQELWADALGASNGHAGGLDAGALQALVAQFSLPAHVIRAAGATARRNDDGGDLVDAAWRAGLAHARVALDELGQRVEPQAGWNSLVVPGPQSTILHEIVAHVRQRGTVYQQWGFDRVLRRGLGVTALFAGGSGTGKTLAAEVVAHELGLDLFVIDLSQVVSKYIGETEKNLRRVFDAAERGGAVLLFDEADALFGKRSEVKDSHDRYANLEVSYLLMRMEAYRGLAVLTTNLKKSLDPAFLRRIRFVVDFPFPAPPERAEIWRRVIPRQVPADGLDMDRLAQLTVAGGSIRNIALSAAFLAADEGCALQMRHLLAASRTEYVKLERALTPGEVAGWV